EGGCGTRPKGSRGYRSAGSGQFHETGRSGAHCRRSVASKSKNRHSVYGIYGMSSKSGIEQLRAVEQQFDAERASVVDSRSLEDIRSRFLSRKSGLLTLHLQALSKLPSAERAEFGRVANLLKVRIERALDELQRTILEREKNIALQVE